MYSALYFSRAFSYTLFQSIPTTTFWLTTEKAETIGSGPRWCNFVVGQLELEPRLHDWSSTSNRSLKSSLSYCHPLWHLLTPYIQVACQLAMISNCRYRFQKVKKHKHIWRYKNKCGILLYCFFRDVFPRWKVLLGKSSSTYYFYVHIILLSYSTPFTPGNYLLNISHCLTAWPVNFSQT